MFLAVAFCSFFLSQSAVSETIICNATQPCTGQTVSCTATDEDCDIHCTSTDACDSAILTVPETTNGATFDIRCTVANSCDNFQVISYRAGLTYCTVNGACDDSYIKIIDRYQDFTTISNFRCASRGCKDAIFYCDDIYECYWQVFGSSGAGNAGRDYIFYCKTGTCNIGSQSDTWANVGSAVLYCDESTQGGYCNSGALPDGWTLDSTNFPSSAPSMAPTEPTRAPTLAPTTESPTVAPVPTTIAPTSYPTWVHDGLGGCDGVLITCPIHGSGSCDIDNIALPYCEFCDGGFINYGIEYFSTAGKRLVACADGTIDDVRMNQGPPWYNYVIMLIDSLVIN